MKTVQAQIRIHILLRLIWVYTACKRTCKETSTLGYFFLLRLSEGEGVQCISLLNELTNSSKVYKVKFITASRIIILVLYPLTTTTVDVFLLSLGEGEFRRNKK